jgi:hypothetical protein
MLVMKIAKKFSSFDAELDTDVCTPQTNANLTLTLRLGLFMQNPKRKLPGTNYGAAYDGNKPGASLRHIVDWNANEWEAFKAKIGPVVERSWSGKFWLVNQKDKLLFSHGAASYAPNVYCKLKLVVADYGSAPHHQRINVVRLHDKSLGFRSNKLNFSNRDLGIRASKLGTLGKADIKHVPVVHEIGHLLGLSHVDAGKPHCPPGSDQNAVACYGLADADQQNMMGYGMHLSVAQAYPWQLALRSLLQINSGGAPQLSDWRPSLRHHLPREVKVAAKTA